MDLWTSDGTAQGTSVVEDFPASSGGSGSSVVASIGELTPFAGGLAFIANGGRRGPGLDHNGTAGGTRMLTDSSLPAAAMGTSLPLMT